MGASTESRFPQSGPDDIAKASRWNAVFFTPVHGLLIEISPALRNNPSYRIADIFEFFESILRR